MNEIKKAIIIARDLGSDYFPLLKILNKESLPLVDRPMIDFIASEALDSEIEKIIFVLSEDKKAVADYFKKRANEKEFLEISKQDKERFKDVSFSFVFQHINKGDGLAIMKAKNYIKNESFAVLSSDDIFEGKISCLEQLKKIFKTANKPIVALKRVVRDKFFSGASGPSVLVEKISNNLYKIKGIEEDSSGGISSDLVMAGRYILNSEIFKYLKAELANKSKASKTLKTLKSEKDELLKETQKETQKGEAEEKTEKEEDISMYQTLNAMIKDGKMIYGYEVSGKWLNCNKQIDWLKTNLYLCLKDPKYGPILKKFLQETF